MARPVRLEFGGALYHVTARGDRRETIYEDDADREHFLEVLGEVVARFNWCCHAYCLMSNHYHLMIATPDANLSKGMRHLNGVFTQWSNRRHDRTGHLFQGRYKAILVDADSYLLELTRYVVLNPVRAHMLDEISSTDGYAFPTTAGGCFVAGTPVLTKDGWCLIENLKVGDLVLSKPEDNSGPAEYKPVVRTFVYEDRAIRRLAFYDEKEGLSYFFVTDEHPIWVEGLGWTPARLVEPYHAVQLANGDPATVMQNSFVYRTTKPDEGWVSDLPGSLHGDIWSFAAPRRHIRRNVSLANELELLRIYEGNDPQLKTTVYNIEVADFHTYYASCVWVHNTSPEHFVLVNKDTGFVDPPHETNTYKSLADGIADWAVSRSTCNMISGLFRDSPRRVSDGRCRPPAECGIDDAFAVAC